MATIDEHLYYRLANFAGLSALVGTRISPGLLQEDSDLPAVTFQRISTVVQHQMGADPGLYDPRYQVDVWGDMDFNADGFSDIIAVGTQVKLALSRYGGTYDGHTIDQIFLDNELYQYEPATKTMRGILDFIVHYRE
jgi:hypothetical protein